MRLAYFSGCKIPFYMKEYDLSFRAIMKHLGVGLVELPFHCCGNPARNHDFEVSVLSAVKNLAIARRYGLDIITPCKCCFGQLKHAMFWYDTRPELKLKIDGLLADEGLAWSGETRVWHLLNFLTGRIGLDVLEKQVKRKMSGKKIVVQYGCHALRPFSVTEFDNPFEPKIFEQVLQITGVEVREWSKRTECCGHPISDLQPELSLKILQNKFDAAKIAGADAICTACTHCQLQYERGKVQNDINDHRISAVLFTRILAHALGIKANCP